MCQLELLDVLHMSGDMFVALSSSPGDEPMNGEEECGKNDSRRLASHFANSAYLSHFHHFYLRDFCDDLIPVCDHYLELACIIN